MHLHELSETKRKLLRRYVEGEVRSDAAPRARPDANSIPLSPCQQQVWLRAMALSDGPPLYNESITIHRRGHLDVTILKRALLEIVRRHEIWRTTFAEQDGEPRGCVRDVPEHFPVPVIDLRGATDPQSEFLRAGNEFVATRVDLQHGPLVKAMLIVLDEEVRLLVMMHQIVTDGISVYDIFPTELATVYEAFAAGQPSPLPELPLQFADYALWQCRALQERPQEQVIAYWSNQFKQGTTPLNWPVGKPRAPVETHAGRIMPFSFGRDVLESCTSLKKIDGVSIFAVLVAALVAVLNSYVNQDDIVVGTLVPTGRHRSEFRRLLGYFLNPVALRLRLTKSINFRELMVQAQEVIAGAMAHGDLPFEDVLKRLAPPPDPSRHPLFQIAISLAPPVAVLPSGWSMTFMDVESGGARWDLYLELSERCNQILGRAEYNPDLFERGAIAALTEDMRAVLCRAAIQPMAALSEITDCMQPLTGGDCD